MRIKELDAFRGIAAMAVVFFHYTTRYDDIFKSNSSVSFDYGWLGVPLFFILSGFVITLTINRSKSPLNFLYRRFIRLYPTYWISIILTYVIMQLSGFSINYPNFNIESLDLAMNFTMFHELFNFRHLDGAYWSLLPEMLFYLLMAFLLFIKKIKNIYVYNGFLLAICGVHYYLPLPIIDKVVSVHYILLFMIGICFYRIYSGDKSIYLHPLIWINLIVGVFLYSVAQTLWAPFYLFFMFLPIVLIFYAFVYKKLVFLGSSKVLVFLGGISYALYLIHQNIGYVIMTNLDGIFLRELNIIIAILIAIFLSWIITFYLEPPLKKLIRKKINL